MFYLVVVLILVNPYAGESNPTQTGVTGPFHTRERCEEYKSNIIDGLQLPAATGQIAITKVECVKRKGKES
jgi:hypothetical protein